MLLEAETDQPGRGGVNGRGMGEEERDERSWLLLRPGRKRVEGWLETWWRRWAVLVGVPCLFVSRPKARDGASASAERSSYRGR